LAGGRAARRARALVQRPPAGDREDRGEGGHDARAQHVLAAPDGPPRRPAGGRRRAPPGRARGPVVGRPHVSSLLGAGVLGRPAPPDGLLGEARLAPALRPALRRGRGPGAAVPRRGRGPPPRPSRAVLDLWGSRAPVPVRAREPPRERPAGFGSRREGSRAVPARRPRPARLPAVRGPHAHARRLPAAGPVRGLGPRRVDLRAPRARRALL